MNITQTAIGIGFAAALAQTGIELVLPRPSERPPVDITNVAYDPARDVISYTRYVLGDDGVHPYRSNVFRTGGGTGVDECRAFAEADYVGTEPTTQTFSLDEFTVDGCRAALLAVQASEPDVCFDLTAKVIPDDGAADDFRLECFRVQP